MAPRVTDPDLECIEHIRNGEGVGLDTLMERHAEALYRFIFRYTNNQEDAADLAQETFVRIFQKAGSFKPAATVKTWIYTIALNLCRDRARRAKRVKWVPFFRRKKDDGSEFGIEDTTPDSGPDPSQSAGALEIERVISEGIRKLPDKQRVPFVMCILEGHSQAEAAKIMDVTSKTIEVRIYRARQQLRKSLGPILEDIGC